jgi:hypothetical protein
MRKWEKKSETRNMVRWNIPVWTEPSHDYIFMPNLGLIKFIVSEKMLLFDFPIGCSMYVKAMPCCEDHLWVPIKKNSYN